MLGGSLSTWVLGLPFFSFIFVMYSNIWYVISPFPLYFSIIGQTKLSEIGISFISFENGKYSSSSAISYNPVDWATWSPTSLAIILVKPLVVWAYFIRRLFQSGFTITLFLIFLSSTLSSVLDICKLLLFSRIELVACSILFSPIHPTNFSLDSQFLHATMHSLSLTPLGS